MKKARLKLTCCAVAALITATGCTKQKQSPTHDPMSESTSPLVELCRNIDYSDTATLHKEVFMKQTIGNIVKLLPSTDSVTTRRALTIFFDGLKRDDKAMQEALRLASRYLNSPDSPVRNETLYIRMLETLLSTDSLPDHIRAKTEERLHTASLNRPGTIAADFRYIDRGGRQSSLHAIDANEMLLVFYDPECPHCPEILERIAKNPKVNAAIEAGEVKVLAVYAEGKRDVWEKTKGDLPSNWTVAYDLTGVLDEDLYDLPAMPIVYLLDAEKRVLVKDMAW